VFIYSVLIALGGMVLFIVAQSLFIQIGVETHVLMSEWILMMGAAATPVFAAYLVQRKKSLIESIAPVLARVFTPLFLATIVGLLAAIVVSSHGLGLDEDRDVLIWFDILLALVLGLVLYTMSSRDAEEAPAVWDGISLALIISAIPADTVALVGVADRISAYGASPNKIAALGINVLFLVNLLVIAVAYALFVARKIRYQRIINLQMGYMPVYLIWAAAVVIALPPIFGWR
jgi:hypothetical protein